MKLPSWASEIVDALQSGQRFEYNPRRANRERSRMHVLTKILNGVHSGANVSLLCPPGYEEENMAMFKFIIQSRGWGGRFKTVDKTNIHSTSTDGKCSIGQHQHRPELKVTSVHYDEANPLVFVSDHIIE